MFLSYYVVILLLSLKSVSLSLSFYLMYFFKYKFKKNQLLHLLFIFNILISYLSYCDFWEFIFSDTEFNIMEKNTSNNFLDKNESLYENKSSSNTNHNDVEPNSSLDESKDKNESKEDKNGALEKNESKDKNKKPQSYAAWWRENRTIYGIEKSVLCGIIVGVTIALMRIEW